ncbi:hypothetical protein IVG45_17050 [Methylomonas sp. LL1]|uniref:hypothetical protein n=1 Tax=Methylomonas sp. LL1 TaxID=2785785 RepID=UPI0018C35D53|nr:hypothetical protein [Methylomonas sp. LL1]QPK62541.1 hypothetical protein IVG45_17050 [Methylomonas sp. LL1]
MGSLSLLSNVVKLYRLCGKPDFNGNSSVNCEILYDEEVRLLINKIYQQKDDILELVSCNESAQSLPIPETQNNPKLKFTLNFPIISGFKRFFLNVDDLISHHTGVKKGLLPDEFYLIENDYLTGEVDEPEKLQQLRKVCRWIVFLKQALPHTEEKRDSYLFVLLTEDKESKGFKKHLIESRFTFHELQNLDGLEYFEEMLTNEDLHSHERLAVVRNALEELLSKRPTINQRLGDILSEFEVFKQLYQDNYETYINGFSLKDFKKEVIEKHEEFAHKIENTLNDVLNKGFSIPISIATIAALIKEKELINGLVISFSVLLISVFMCRLIKQHRDRLKDIKLALNEVFEKFENREESAAQFVNDKQNNLIKRSESIDRDLERLNWLSLTPFLIVIILLFYKYPEILTFFQGLLF